MKLTFRTVSGETFSLEFDSTSLVQEVKDRVCAERSLEKSSLKLLYKGKALDKDAVSLADAGLSEEGFIVVFAPKPKPAAPAAGAGTSAVGILLCMHPCNTTEKQPTKTLKANPQICAQTSFMRTQIQTRARAHTHTHTHSQHTNTNTRTHTHTLTHTLTNTYTHAGCS